MRQEGLAVIEYEWAARLALLIYNAGAHYNLDDIITYVEDMSEGKAQRILIYEEGHRMHEVVRTPGNAWIDICTAPMS
jgi:hypothetical protein